MGNNRVKSITITGMLAALIFLATWALHVPAGLNGGYVHFGDALVYIAAALLPTPLAMAASAIGAGLSDLLSPGAAVWALPTVIIKSLCCLPFISGGEKLLNKRNILATLFAGLITIAGYFAATVVISGSVATAAVEIPLSAIQAAGSAACFVAIAAALDRTKLKSAFGLKVSK